MGSEDRGGREWAVKLAGSAGAGWEGAVGGGAECGALGGARGPGRLGCPRTAARWEKLQARHNYETVA